MKNMWKRSESEKSESEKEDRNTKNIKKHNKWGIKEKSIRYRVFTTIQEVANEN